LAEISANPQGNIQPMAPIALALFLFMTGQPAADPAAATAEAAPAAAQAPAPEATPAEDRFPAGAPHDDYQFVSWCYGSLRGYLDLHDQVMPEVTRIETTFRPPGRKLSDDLKVYADMQKDGRAQLKLFQSAMTAAEKASLRPINTVGAAAVAKGRDVWKSGPGVTPARMAQAWMSWALPARCETTAKTLHDRAVLMGASFKVNEEAEPPADAAPPAPATAPEPQAAPPETPPAPSPNPN
jgi:hypothetical protein